LILILDALANVYFIQWGSKKQQVIDASNRSISSQSEKLPAKSDLQSAVELHPNYLYFWLVTDKLFSAIFWQKI